MPHDIPNPLPRRLNFGCGYIRPGYLNVDFIERHGSDLLADVTSLPSDRLHSRDIGTPSCERRVDCPRRPHARWIDV